MTDQEAWAKVIDNWGLAHQISQKIMKRLSTRAIFGDVLHSVLLVMQRYTARWDPGKGAYSTYMTRCCLAAERTIRHNLQHIHFSQPSTSDEDYSPNPITRARRRAARNCQLRAFGLGNDSSGQRQKDEGIPDPRVESREARKQRDHDELLSELIEPLKAQLSEREQTILEFCIEHGGSLQGAADLVGLSRERVRQLKLTLVKTLRRELLASLIEHGLDEEVVILSRLLKKGAPRDVC